MIGMLTQDLRSVLVKVIDTLYEGRMNKQQYNELMEELDKIPTTTRHKY